MPWVEIVSGSQHTEMGGKIGISNRVPPIVHWVVITGMSEQWDANRSGSPFNWVRIYNPFDNQVEYYSWADFESTWSGVTWSHEVVLMRRVWTPFTGPSPLP